MAFLDKKTRIIDMTLTDRGRELLATGQLSIQSYAFSDELVDYSGSLAQALRTNASLDDVVYRNYIPVQADQMNQSGLHRDLTSFLYTAPDQRDVLPVMQITETSLTLSRLYHEEAYDNFVYGTMNTEDDGKFVVLMKMNGVDAKERTAQYLSEQNLAKIEDELPELLSLSKT